MKKLIKIGSQFSGVGAFEQSLQRLGINYENIYAADLDKYARQTYLLNFEEPKYYVKDVYDTPMEEITENYGSLDIAMFSPPCQSFSLAGKRKGEDSKNGVLFYNSHEFIVKNNPRYFIFENVKGLLNHDNGNTFETIKATFDELGYKYFYQVLNAKNFGIPQHRERIFVVGFKDNSVNFQFPEGITLEHKMQDFLEDYTDSKYYLKEKGVKFVTSSKNRTKRYTQINGDVALCQTANQQYNTLGTFVDDKYFLSEKLIKTIMATQAGNWKFNPTLNTDIAKTLVATMHKMHRASIDNYVTVDGRLRKLTPRECLRLMGFPDTFKQVVSDVQIYKQAGNSIVVDVLMELMKEILKTGVFDKNK